MLKDLNKGRTFDFVFINLYIGNMENTQSISNQQSTESTSQQQASQNNSKLFVAVVFIIFLTGIITGSIVYFWQKTTYDSAVEDLKQRIVSLEQQQNPTEETEVGLQPISTDLDWKKVNIQPNTKLGISFQPFDLYYPADWNLKIDNEPDYALVVTLKKNGSTITIRQVEEGRGDCYYTGEHDKAEGMAQQYGNYTEISKKGLTWRVAALDFKPTEYDVCELDEANKAYRGFTKVGAIFMDDQSSGSQNLGTLKMILDKIEVLE